MHTIERSTARMAFHLDESLEKVQSGAPVRFGGLRPETGASPYAALKTAALDLNLFETCAGRPVSKFGY
jgi:hypothetical protein